MNYLLHILIMICIYVILTLSLNLVVGYAGLLSLCHAAFYGIGAYTTTLLMVKAGINFFPAVIGGIIFAIIVSLIVSVPSFRLKGDYFVLAGLGFQIIIFSILYNWVGLTRGPYGIPGIPRPNILGFEFDSIPVFFVLSLVLALLVTFLTKTLYDSPFGLVLKSIREDEIVALSLGRDINYFKTSAFAISAGIAAIAGSLYATYVTYIDPTSFTIDESIFIITIVLVGGSGNLKGPIIGTVFMIILPELLRFLGIPDTIAPNVRQMIYGVVLIFLMRKRPQGIAGEYGME
ncbi:MAG: branched-chain amino acid ABC transporter permease [candidate division WOR-3 bacterium]